MVCSAKIASGEAKCSPSSQRLLKVGSHDIVATYAGASDFLSSSSTPVKVTITAA